MLGGTAPGQWRGWRHLLQRPMPLLCMHRGVLCLRCPDTWGAQASLECLGTQGSPTLRVPREAWGAQALRVPSKVWSA